MQILQDLQKPKLKDDDTVALEKLNKLELILKNEHEWEDFLKQENVELKQQLKSALETKKSKLFSH